MFLIPDRTFPCLSESIEDYPEGIVIPMDKPWRWTSADVIRKVKYAAVRHFHKKNLKVGHAGTLDPLATGILLVCIGPATRQAETLQKHDKEYIADIVFGATTPSYDLEKEIDRRYPYEQIDAEALRSVLPSFLGEQEQVAPLFSAKSVDGVRAYEMARRLYKSGGDLDEAALSALTRQRIVISDLELLAFYPAGTAPQPALPADASAASSRIHVAEGGRDLPMARIRIACSKGTYIRAFARDLGEALGSGAHLGALQRSRSGQFAIADALTLEETIALLQA